MSLKLFRSPFVFYCDVSNHDDIKSRYYNRLKDITYNDENSIVKQWNCDVRSTFNFTVDCLWDSYFQDSVIWKPLDQMLTEVDINFYPTTSRVSGVWANFYKVGQFQEVHNHLGSRLNHFSGIYILDQKGENRTSFNNYNYGLLDSHLDTKNIDDIKEGSVIIFPSNLLHYVNPVDDNRCTISFNIRCEF